MVDYLLGDIVSDEELRERCSAYPQPYKTQCVAFYDWLEVRKLYLWSETVAWFFDTFGAKLQKVAWNDPLPEKYAKPKNTRWRSGQLISFPKLRTALESGAMARAETISCMNLRLDASMPWTDWTAFANAVQDYGYDLDRRLFYGVVQEVGSLTTDQQMDLARRVASVFGTCYGTVYYWPHFYGSYSYSFGSCLLDRKRTSEVDFNELFFGEEGKQMDRWSANGRAFPVRDGYFRDIYPMSFLPESHLRAPIEGVSFETWQQRSGIGTLTEIVPGFAAWEVPREQEEEARTILRRNNRLLAYIDKTP